MKSNTYHYSRRKSISYSNRCLYKHLLEQMKFLFFK